jgi:hypothetical protein
MYWPVGDFHDETTRLLGGHIHGFESRVEAQAVIGQILDQQRKPHHVSYRVAEYVSFAEFKASGVIL